jgi:hypothetical protein
MDRGPYVVAAAAVDGTAAPTALAAAVARATLRTERRVTSGIV